jgi:hypothetical protein
MVLLIAAFAFALTQGGNEASLNPIAQAAVRTEESPGARMAFHATVRSGSGDRPIAMTGAGVYNGHTNRTRMTMTVPTPTGRLAMEVVGSGSQMYFRSKLFHSRLPPGDEWIGLDAALGMASETGVGTNSDPVAQLDRLKAVSDEFETLGKRKIRGTETTAYRSTFDLKGYAEYLRRKGSLKAATQYERVAEAVPSTTEVVTWIDAKGLVRRMGVTAESQDPNSRKTTSTDMTVDFYDFGISPEIQLPDPNTVQDVTPMVRAKLGLDSSS